MKRVLVIDDNANFARMLVRTLEKNGINALTADCTKAASLALSLMPVDAVILDIVLGRENGWDTLQQLRKLSDTPILLVTGAGVDDAMKLDAEKLGAQGVLQKPFESKELMILLSSLLKDQ
jgi:two-component system response regulator ResD